MIHVLMLTSSAGYGGGPQHIFDLAKSLRGTSLVDIACPFQEPYYELFRTVIDGEIIEIPERSFSLVYLFKLLIFTHRRGISLLHSHGKGAGLYGRLISLLYRIPLVHTPHGIHIDQYRGFFRSLYRGYEFLGGFIDTRTIFVSPSESERALKLGIGRKSRSCVICNGVSSQDDAAWQLETRERIRKKLGLGEQDVVLVALSRFDYAKNMFEMVSIARETPEVKFLLLGDGPDYEKVKMSASRLATENVYLPGFVNNPLDYLAAADLYCSTSRWEGLPLAVLQAMSLSLPVVASNVTGNRDAVRVGESGYLYELGNIKEAAKYVKILVANPKLRSQLGARGKMRQQDDFSLSNMASKTLDVYKTVLREKQKNAC